ncbi:hypothetical protein [Parasphingorhabdus sp.]|uniref:hypothetical protein n=1 Tax=Parasphingorhabdus sp. TaxID=2709688 RepID=UPI0007F34FD6|nr:hypothetical protein A8B75_14680 [Sphingomonadales bacterium EhC05]
MDAADILNDMLGALQGELSDGYSEISEFAERQGRMLAKQAEHLAKERADGFLTDDDELFAFFLEGMQRDTENMARSIAMLTVLTIEKAWNAVANALWGGLRTILAGAGVPGSLLPETPPLIT